MKKNITINLLGRLYAIDEDAYELLERYTDSLRNYFRRREGGEEIVDDIEARIAELFDELKSKGTEAITIEHVEDIIHRVGSPEEMDSPSPDSPRGEEGFSSQFTDGNGPAPSMGEAGRGAKRLYRNMADRKLMGVLSGFATYFGGDVLWWRLGFLVMFFLTPGGVVHRMFDWGYWNWGISLNFTLIILYIVLGILMPVADTPEDRLRMKGKEVNPQNLADEVSQPQSQANEGGHMGCLGGFFFILGTLIRWFFYGIGIALAFSLLTGIVALTAAMTMPHSLIHESDPAFWQFFDANQTHLMLASVLCLVVLAIPAYCLIHSLFSEIRLLQPMGIRQRVMFLVTWILTFVVAAVVCTGLAGKVKDALDHSHDISDEKYRKENTHDGIFYRPDEWEFLSERGWRVLRAEHCDRYTAAGQYYTDTDARYIDTYDSRHRQLFTIERTEELQPGHYLLSACVRADGQGAYVYAFIDGYNQAPWLKEIPADDNTGGDIWREAKQWLENERKEHGDTICNMEIYNRMRDIAHANSEQGYGWNRITLPDIVIPKPAVLHYGVSTVPSLTGQSFLGHWFSACDFELKRMDNNKK